MGSECCAWPKDHVKCRNLDRWVVWEKGDGSFALRQLGDFVSLSFTRGTERSQRSFGSSFGTSNRHGWLPFYCHLSESIHVTWFHRLIKGRVRPFIRMKPVTPRAFLLMYMNLAPRKKTVCISPQVFGRRWSCSPPWEIIWGVGVTS